MAQNLLFSGSHLVLQLWLIMLIPQQVKHTVDDKDGYLLLYRMPVFLRLYYCLRVGNNHLTQVENTIRGLNKRGKG